MQRALLFRDFVFSEVIEVFSNVLTSKHLSFCVSCALTLIIAIVGAILLSVNTMKAKSLTNDYVDAKSKEKKYHIADFIALPCFVYAVIMNMIMLYKENHIDVVYLYDIFPVLMLAVVPYFIIASEKANFKVTIVEALKHCFAFFAKFIAQKMFFIIIIMLMCLLKW